MTRESGVFTRAQLAELGIDDATLRRETRAGNLVRLRPGWYAARGADERVVAAVRAGGALSCVSALAWYGLWVPPGYAARTHLRRSRAMSTRAESCDPAGPRLPIRQPVDPIGVALGAALRCMTDEDWIAVCDSYLNSHRISVPDVQAELGLITRRTARLLDRADARSQSGTESIVRVRLRTRRFTVVVQPRIAGVGHVDLRIGRLLLECDGRQYHSSAESYRNDRHRDRKSLIDNWLTMRLTYDDIIFGWSETLADITAVTDADRHRIRNRRSLEALRRSAENPDHEGNLPS